MRSALLEQGHASGRRAPVAGRRPCRPGRSPPPPRSCRFSWARSRGWIQPSSQPRSTIWHSMVLMVTGLSLDVEGAAGLAGRGADAAGEFREIVGGVQRLRRGAPLVAIDQIVPVGDQIVDRAALVTEGNAAIHAARRLLADLGIGQRMDEFADSCGRALPAFRSRGPAARFPESL